MSLGDAFKSTMTAKTARERILTLAMRAALSERPSDSLEADLVRRMADTARTAREEAGEAAQRAALARRVAAPRRTARSRAGLAARLAGSVAAFVMALGGMAVAGVTLPQPAQDAFSRVGIHLPNQAGGNHDVTTGDDQETDGTAPDSPGGDRGKSKAAHDAVLKARAERRAKGHGKKLGYDKGKAIGLNGATPPGIAGQGGASSQGAGQYSGAGNGGGQQHPSSGSRGHSAPRGKARGHSGSPGNSAGRGH